jgi:hypothetical protein
MIELSEQAGNAILNTIADMLNGGSIELLYDNGEPLAVLYLSDPAAAKASGGEVELNHIFEDIAPATGTATSARVLGSNGREVLVCNVGDMDSDAVIRLNPQRIIRGQPVRINSFKLAMP